VAIDREKILAFAQKYVDKKRYDRAVIEYQKVIEEDPNDARTLLKIGDLQSKMEQYASAVATYDRVGRFYSSQGFSLKAIAVYKQIREIIAKHVPQLEERYAHVTPKLAELYQHLGLTSDALGVLDEVATRLHRQGREQDAIEVFRKIVDLDSTNPLPHLRLAEALSRAKDADGAVAEFALAADQLSSLGRQDDALKVIERLLQHRPDPVHARAAAELYLTRNAPNDGLQALAKLQICFQANPRDLDTLGLLGRAFNHIGQAAKAIEVQKEMARIARDTGKTELFQEILDRLLKLVPNDEAVRQLASGPVPGASSAPPPQVASGTDPTAPPARGGRADEDYESVGDAELDDGEPIELSRRPERRSDDAGVLVEDEVLPPSELPVHAGEQVAAILASAAAARRAESPVKAIATLRAGVRDFPRSIELREALRDILLDTARAQEAVQEMLEIAELQIERLDAEEAAATLQDVLAAEPRNARATEMLQALGYELVEEPSQASPMEQLGNPAPDPDAPLPAYNLDDIDEPDVDPRFDGRRSPPAEPMDYRASTQEIEEIDDPFAEVPLPSFPLEAPTAVAAARLPRPGAELESALEEAEFFESRGLFDDARAILDEQLARLPNHPLVLERLAEIDAQEREVHGDSGTRPSPSAGSIEDRAFDIAESLGALDAGDRTSGVGPGPISAAGTEQVDVEEVFAKFKEGVAKQIGADDSQSHYDLGLAYKDMGLLDDAMREFETAARDPRRACVCHSMIGMIHLERGNINEAIDALLRGLQSPERTREQEAALSYELGAAHEVRRMNKQALEYFQRSARLIPGFRDVAERVRRLQKTEPAQPARAVAVGADDEFDRAFEDMLGKNR
jgi:tetratricopeptide (TPR) repeat protein